MERMIPEQLEELAKTALCEQAREYLLVAAQRERDFIAWQKRHPKTKLRRLKLHVAADWRPSKP